MMHELIRVNNVSHGYRTKIPPGFRIVINDNREIKIEENAELVNRLSSYVFEVDSVGSTGELLKDAEGGSVRILIAHEMLQNGLRSIFDDAIRTFPGYKDKIAIHLLEIEGDKSLIDISVLDDQEGVAELLKNSIRSLVATINNHIIATGSGIPLRMSIWHQIDKANSIKFYATESDLTPDEFLRDMIVEYVLEGIVPLEVYEPLETVVFSSSRVEPLSLYPNTSIETRVENNSITLVLAMPKTTEIERYNYFVLAAISDIRDLFPVNELDWTIRPTSDKRIIFVTGKMTLGLALELNNRLRTLLANMSTNWPEAGISYSIGQGIRVHLTDEVVTLGASASWTAKNALPGKVVAVGEGASIVPENLMPGSISTAWESVPAVTLELSHEAESVSQQILYRYAVRTFVETANPRGLNLSLMRNSSRLPDVYSAQEAEFGNTGDRYALANLFLHEKLQMDPKAITFLSCILDMGEVISQHTLIAIERIMVSEFGEWTPLSLIQSLLDSNLVSAISSKDGQQRYLLSKGTSRAIRDSLTHVKEVTSIKVGTLQCLKMEYAKSTQSIDYRINIVERMSSLNSNTSPRLIIELLRLSISMDMLPNNAMILMMAAVNRAYNLYLSELNELLQLLTSRLVSPPQKPSEMQFNDDISRRQAVEIRRFYCACMVILNTRYSIKIDSIDEYRLELISYSKDATIASALLPIEQEALALSILAYGDNQPVEALVQEFPASDSIDNHKFTVEYFAEMVRRSSHEELSKLIEKAFGLWGDGFKLLIDRKEYGLVVKLCNAFFNLASKDSVIFSQMSSDMITIHLAIGRYFIDIIESIPAGSVDKLSLLKLRINRFFLEVFIWIKGQEISSSVDDAEIDLLIDSMSENLDLFKSEIVRRISSENININGKSFDDLYYEAFAVFEESLSTGDATAVMYSLNNLVNLISLAPKDHPLNNRSNLMRLLDILNSISNPNEIWNYLDTSTRTNQVDTLVEVICAIADAGITIPASGAIKEIIKLALSIGIGIKPELVSLFNLEG